MKEIDLNPDAKRKPKKPFKNPKIGVAVHKAVMKLVTVTERLPDPGGYEYRFDLWLPRHGKWFCSITYLKTNGSVTARKRLEYAAKAVGVKVDQLKGEFNTELAIETFMEYPVRYNNGKEYCEIRKFLPVVALANGDALDQRLCNDCCKKPKRRKNRRRREIRDMFANESNPLEESKTKPESKVKGKGSEGSE